jgi:hypothetical protein
MYPWIIRWKECIKLQYNEKKENISKHFFFTNFLHSDNMRLLPASSLGLLAFSGLISAGPVVPRNTDAIPNGIFNTIRFLEQYAAAAYCSENFRGDPRGPVRCKAGNCLDVERDDTQIVRKFDR